MVTWTRTTSVGTLRACKFYKLCVTTYGIITTRGTESGGRALCGIGAHLPASMCPSPPYCTSNLIGLDLVWGSLRVPRRLKPLSLGAGLCGLGWADRMIDAWRYASLILFCFVQSSFFCLTWRRAASAMYKIGPRGRRRWWNLVICLLIVRFGAFDVMYSLSATCLISSLGYYRLFPNANYILTNQAAVRCLELLKVLELPLIRDVVVPPSGLLP